MPKEKESADATTKDVAKTSTTADLGQTQLQGTFDKANEQGFFGTEIDPTPNENYTVSGVTSNAPTPETDAELASQVREHTKMGKSAIELNAIKEKK